MIEGTVDVDRLHSEAWDVIVVGAGPAGALAARQLALAGRRVLLVDGKRFPRSKVCGACLNGQALAILDSVGLGCLPRSLGGVAVNQFEVRDARRAVRLTLPPGYAVSRARFDTALVEAAIDSGSEFLPECTATIGFIESCSGAEYRIVSLHCRESVDVNIRARVVLAADGLGHASLREHPEFASRVARGARIGLGGQVSDYPSAYAAGTISMAVGRHGYVGLVRVEDGLLNIAGALTLEFVKAASGPAAALGAVVEEAGFPAIDSLSQADWQGTIALSRRTPRTAGRRVFLLGDAAGYVEPFTGEGMAWALAAAAAIEPFVNRGLASWSEVLERDWQNALRRLVQRRQTWCRLLALASRHPLVGRIALGAVSLFPSIARPIIRHVNRPPTLEFRL